MVVPSGDVKSLVILAPPLTSKVIPIEDRCGILVARKPVVVGAADAKPILKVEIGKCEVISALSTNFAP
jgi:hypothetical protein